jgi:hypothetical protein
MVGAEGQSLRTYTIHHCLPINCTASSDSLASASQNAAKSLAFW